MKKDINKPELLMLLNSKLSHPLFKEEKTNLEVEELPFYAEYSLVKAKTFSTIPAVEFCFLWSEKENNAIKINGDRDCFFDNIELLKPQISAQSAVAYVKFVLGSVWDDNGAIKLCENIDDVEFSSDPTPSQLSFLTENITPASIVEADDKFVVECNIIYGTALFKAKIELLRDGLFDFIEESLIGEEIDALRTIFLE